MALITCKECGAQVSNKASACAACGAPTKTNYDPILWVVALILGLCLFFFAALELPSLGTRKSQLDPQKPPQSNFPAEHNLNYRKAALGELKSGSLLRFTGEVLQLIEPDGLRVATKTGVFSGYSGDDVFLVFDAKPRTLEHDTIEVMGRYDGTMRYETVMRTERVVPRIRVDYYTILKTQE